MTDTKTTKTIKYDVAVTRGSAAVNAADKALTRAAWTLGDLAASVETKYGNDTVQQLAADISAATGTELAVGTLRNYRTTATKYAPAGPQTTISACMRYSTR